MLLVFLLTSPFILASSHLYEQFAPADHWFEYYAVKPASQSFDVGETLRFNSFIEYRRDVGMRWEDTLFCVQDGGIKKYPTQVWPDNGDPELKNPGLVNIDTDEQYDKLTFWEYYIAQPDDSATECYLQGVAIGTTRLGYQKNQFFVTDQFYVNQNATGTIPSTDQ